MTATRRWRFRGAREAGIGRRALEGWVASTNEYDAIVVGSGITGGWAAKELCERGLRTLVLEAGRDVVPERDYKEHVPTWDMPFRGLGNRRHVAARQQVQSRSVSFDEFSHVFWIDDVDNP